VQTAATPQTVLQGDCVRLFVALQIPEDVRNILTALTKDLRKACPTARWVDLQKAHVTLKFIGEVGPAQGAEIRDALKAVTDRLPVLMATSLRDKVLDVAPFEMVFAGLGFFPDARRPRVFWAGVDGGAALARLDAAIEDSLAAIGVPRETREFHPHLTLARVDAAVDTAVLRKAISGRDAVEFGRTKVDEFSLYQSVLKSAGAEYTRLATYPLSGEQAS
jgi:RNA 2',3'-cyclic 3'-phosphodiesterase